MSMRCSMLKRKITKELINWKKEKNKKYYWYQEQDRLEKHIVKVNIKMHFFA